MAGDAEAKARISHDKREHPCRQHARGNADPWRDAEMVPQQRRDIGADAHEAAMPERHQAEAAHDRPRGIGERPDQDQHQDVQVIGVAIDEGQRNQRRYSGCPGRGSRVHERLASRPAGRMNIMTMKKAKASTYPHSRSENSPPSEMISANTNAAIKPPTKLPSPPSTQIRKVIGPNDRPTKGCTSYCSTRRQAARPASAPPSAEVMR